MKLPIQAAAVLRQAALLSSSTSSGTGLRVAGKIRPAGRCEARACSTDNPCPSTCPYCCANGTMCCETSSC